MKCPKCKMDNPPKQDHCAFCYERLRNISAADTYLKAMRRARDKERSKEAADEKSTSVSIPVPTLQIPWEHMARGLRRGVTRYGRAIAALLGGLVFLFLIEEGLDPAIRFHYLGALLHYAPNAAPLTYVTGSTTDVRRWSERAGQMDTPMGDIRQTEVGTVNVRAGRTPEGADLLTVTSNNWMTTIGSGKTPDNRVLAGNSPLLAPAAIELDRHGRVARRQQGTSIRVARCMELLTPILPGKRLHTHDTWTDTADWSDMLDGWTFHWSVVRRWRLAEPLPCGDHACVRMVYDATLTPHLAAAPDWMANARWQFSPIAGSGEAVFDMTAHQLLSHRLDYAGVVRASIADLSDIPSAMRVGRRAFHMAGEIIFDLQTSLTLQRN